MYPVPPLAQDDRLAPTCELREVVAPWAGVLHGTLIGGCAWALLLGVWLLA